MSQRCEGFQPGIPLRQPAPATAFVPFSLHRSSQPHGSPPGSTKRKRTPCPSQRLPALHHGPTATAICSCAGGRTTPQQGLGQPRGWPGPTWASASPWSSQRTPAAPGTFRLLWSHFPSASSPGQAPKCPVGLASLRSGDQPTPQLGFPQLNHKTKRRSDRPGCARTIPPSLVLLLLFFRLHLCSFFPPLPPHPVPTFCHHYYNKYKGSVPKKRLQKHK